MSDITSLPDFCRRGPEVQRVSYTGLVTTRSISSRARGARRADGSRRTSGTPRDSCAGRERRSIRPQLVGHQGDRNAPGADCLTLALRATSAPARTQPRAADRTGSAATSAPAHELQEVPSLRRPYREALQDRRPGRSRRCAIPSGPWTASLDGGFNRRLSQGRPSPSAAHYPGHVQR